MKQVRMKLRGSEEDIKELISLLEEKENHLTVVSTCKPQYDENYKDYHQFFIVQSVKEWKT